MSGVAADPARHGLPIDSLVAFREHARTHPLGVLSTLGPDGAPQATLVGFAVTTEGHLLLDAPVDSRKVANLGRDSRVAVVLGLGEVTVQGQGTARLPVDEAEHAAWVAQYQAAFPQARADQPGMTVARVELSWIAGHDATTTPSTHRAGPVRW